MRQARPADRRGGGERGRAGAGGEKSDHCVELKLRSGVDGIIERHPVTRRAKGRAKCKLNQEDARARTPSAPICFRWPRARYEDESEVIRSSKWHSWLRMFAEQRTNWRIWWMPHLWVKNTEFVVQQGFWSKIIRFFCNLREKDHVWQKFRVHVYVNFGSWSKNIYYLLLQLQENIYCCIILELYHCINKLYFLRVFTRVDKGPLLHSRKEGDTSGVSTLKYTCHWLLRE